MSETVVRHKAFRYRVYPTPDQQARLSRWTDALRFLWNLAHEQRLLGLAKPRDERKFWSNAANNARAMGEADWTHPRGSYLAGVSEAALRTFQPKDHGVGCRCEGCVGAWEVAAHDVEHEARRLGVDPKRHRFSSWGVR